VKQSLLRRLERVESALAPPEKNVLVMRVTSPGRPDWTIELPLGEPTRGKRGDTRKSK
jgi:hypothetical protein